MTKNIFLYDLVPGSDCLRSHRLVSESEERNETADAPCGNRDKNKYQP